VEQNLDIETTRNEDHYGAAIHHLSLLRNKRCLMAYMYESKNSQMSKIYISLYADNACLKLILSIL
jgi:GINS complex subunit 1